MGIGVGGGVDVCGGGGGIGAASVCGRRSGFDAPPPSKRVRLLDYAEAKALFVAVNAQKRPRLSKEEETSKKKKQHEASAAPKIAGHEGERSILVSAQTSFKRPSNAALQSKPKPINAKAEDDQTRTEQQQQASCTSATYKDTIAIARTKLIQIKREAARRAIEKVEEEAAERIKKEKPIGPQDILQIFPALHYQYLCSWPKSARKTASDSARSNKRINATLPADDDIEEGEIII